MMNQLRRKPNDSHPRFGDGDFQEIPETSGLIVRRTKLSLADKLIINSATGFCLAKKGCLGQTDYSLQVSSPGFVQVVAENALIFPWRVSMGGMNWLESFHENPDVELYFTTRNGEHGDLHIDGVASRTNTPSLLRSMPGARFAVRVTIMSIYANYSHIYLNNNEKGFMPKSCKNENFSQISKPSNCVLAMKQRISDDNY